MKVERYKFDDGLEIFKCSDTKRKNKKKKVWIQMWCTEREWTLFQKFLYVKGILDQYPLARGLIKHWWVIPLQRYYIFFYPADIEGMDTVIDLYIEHHIKV